MVAPASSYPEENCVTRTLSIREPARLPPVLHYGADHPLPLRAVRWPAHAPRRSIGLESPPWLATGPVGHPFDFCGHVRRLCADIVQRCPELRHIDVARVLFAMTQARSCRTHGLQARVTPLRFRNGALTRRHHDVTYRVQRYLVDGQEMLYLVTFCLPRFLDRDFDDKFVTLFHELYHISPRFEGDLRRDGGRGGLHPGGKQEYDVHMAHLARAYLASGADPALYAFLRLSFAQLQYRHRSVVGVVVPRPRLLPTVE
jgi:hypothetical protein